MRVVGPSACAEAGAPALGLCGALAMISGIAAAQTHQMKIGSATINDPQHDTAVRVGGEVKKRSNGRISYQVYPASQPGTIPRQIEGLLLGTPEVYIGPPGFFVGVNQAFQVPDAPGAYVNLQHGHQALTDPIFRDKFLGNHSNPEVREIYALFRQSVEKHRPKMN